MPTGALLGLDAVTAAAEGRIQSVRMITRKPPSGLAGAPYLEANASRSRVSTRPSGYSLAPPERGRRDFPPTSSWRRRCRSRVSDPTAP